MRYVPAAQETNLRNVALTLDIKSSLCIIGNNIKNGEYLNWLEGCPKNASKKKDRKIEKTSPYSLRVSVGIDLGC
jgi:hypothetical protein